ncbi:MAG: hypothetical protein ACE5HV_10800 [Acidobacteriota bacterium]
MRPNRARTSLSGKPGFVGFDLLALLRAATRLLASVCAFFEAAVCGLAGRALDGFALPTSSATAFFFCAVRLVVFCLAAVRLVVFFFCAFRFVTFFLPAVRLVFFVAVVFFVVFLFAALFLVAVPRVFFLAVLFLAGFRLLAFNPARERGCFFEAALFFLGRVFDVFRRIFVFDFRFVPFRIFVREDDRRVADFARDRLLFACFRERAARLAVFLVFTTRFFRLDLLFAIGVSPPLPPASPRCPLW